MKRLALLLSVGFLDISGCKVSYSSVSDGRGAVISKGPVISVDPDVKDQASVEVVYEEQSVDPSLLLLRTVTSFVCETDRRGGVQSMDTLIDRSEYQARRDLRIKAGRADADVLKYQTCNGEARGDRTGCTECVGSLYSYNNGHG